MPEAFRYEVLLIGGKLKGVTEAIVGAEALEKSDHLISQKDFWNECRFTHRGLPPDSEKRWSRKKRWARCAQCFVLADSSKIGQVTSITFSDMKRI